MRNLTELNTSATETRSSVTSDGLAIYFFSERNGSGEIFKASRNSLNDPFGDVEHLSFLDSPDYYVAGHPGISADGTALYFCVDSSSVVSNIYVTYIPEPATIVLLGAAIPWLLRKRRNV